MSSSDCFYLGIEALKTKEYYHSSLWLNESLNRLDESETHFTNVDILYNLAIAYKFQSIFDLIYTLTILFINFTTFYYQGNFASALDAINQILNYHPNDRKFLKVKIHLEKYLSHGIEESITEIRKRKNKKIENKILSTKELPFYYTDPKTDDNYQKILTDGLCRGDIKPSAEQMATVSCKYVRNKSAFLKIGPLKLEEISLSPYIVIYHDAIYDAEIEVLKRMAKKKVSFMF